MAELLLTPGGGAPGLRGVPYYSVPQCGVPYYSVPQSGVPYYRALVWPSCATTHNAVSLVTVCLIAMNIPMAGSAL